MDCRMSQEIHFLHSKLGILRLIGKRKVMNLKKKIPSKYFGDGNQIQKALQSPYDE